MSPFFKRRISLFILFFIFLCFIFVFYFKYRDSFSDNTTQSNTSSKQIIITFYYQQNNQLCPDCNRAKSEWDAFIQEKNGKTINGYSIVCNTIDCSNDKDPNIINILTENNIKELPSIRIVVNGKKLNYNSEITQSNLDKFINYMLNMAP
jgi:hypothetical protein